MMMNFYCLTIIAFAIEMFCQQKEARFGSYWSKFATASDGVCAVHNVKLLSLLNLLCNTTQTTSIQMRDACYGCFFRAGSIMSGPTQLNSLNDCSRLYISNSQYSICAANLQATIDGNRPTTGPIGPGFCYSGYCDFVRCVRRINAQQLIASCYAESLGNRELEEDLDRIFFYTNITSCILARSRCSQYNPISGELQNNYVTTQVSVGLNKIAAIADLGQGWGGTQYTTTTTQTLYFNSLQVSETGDLRVLTFPTATTTVADLFCSRFGTLQQSSFGIYNC